jgi:hypothetical protein
MDKLGLKESLAKVFDEVGKKLSVWLANKYLKYYYDLGKSYAERELTSQDIIEMPKPRFNDNWSPNINKTEYNQLLRERLNEI